MYIIRKSHFSLKAQKKYGNPNVWKPITAKATIPRTNRETIDYLKGFGYGNYSIIVVNDWGGFKPLFRADIKRGEIKIIRSFIQDKKNLEEMPWRFKPND